MSERDSFKREGGEDEEEIDETQYKHAKDAILFVIDISSSMLAVRHSSDPKKDAGDSAVSAALKCAHTIMQQRIISNPNDMMGILLYGTEESKLPSSFDSSDSLAYPHCYSLTELAIPAAEDVLKLRELVSNPDKFHRLIKPSKERVALHNVFFCVNQIFATQAANFTSRRLFLITDNDNPPETKELRETASVRAKDLYDLGIVIELFPIAPSGGEFTKSKFYDDIVYSGDPSDPNAPASLTQPTKVSGSQDGITLLNSLLSSIDSKSVPKRALFSNLPFEIGPGFRISVKGYIIFKRQEVHKTSYVYLHGEKALLAKSVSTRFEDDEGKTVQPGRVLKAYKFGGTHITFTQGEVAAMRNFGEPIIRLLGFKAMTPQNLPPWANTNRSTFIYPSEEGFVGSTRVFAALHAKLLASQKIGVAWYVARKNASPVLVAIVPGTEQVGDSGEPEVPSGLWLVPLPYADDVRAIPDHSPVPASDALTDKMKTVVQQLQLPKGKYVPSRYPNPALQWHYRVLQSMALEETIPDKPEDKTVPRYRQIHKRAGPYVLEWGEQLEDDYRAWEQISGQNQAIALPKRPVDAAAGGPNKSPEKKRIKTEEHGGGPPEDDMQTAWKQDRVAKFTVADLKAFAAAKGIAVGGKKAELVEQIEAWFENR